MGVAGDTGGRVPLSRKQFLVQISVTVWALGLISQVWARLGWVVSECWLVAGQMVGGGVWRWLLAWGLGFGVFGGTD